MFALFVQVFKTEKINEASFPQLIEIARTKEELKSMRDINISLAKRNGDSVRQCSEDERLKVVEIKLDEDKTVIEVVDNSTSEVYWATKIFTMEI